MKSRHNSKRCYALCFFLITIILSYIFLVPWFVYPVLVTFKFNYNGQAYERSYTTVMRVAPCDFELCNVRWDPGRDKISMPLPDGSLVILQAGWPHPWQKLQHGTIYQSRGRWMWLNKAKAPTEIVYADGGPRLPLNSDRASSFTRISVDATIQRIGESSLIEARVADGQRDEVTADVLDSNVFGGRQTDKGRLFAGIEANFVQGEGLARIRDLPGWVNLGDGCRMIPRQIGGSITMGFDMDPIEDRMLLYRDHLWSDESAPHPAEGDPSVIYAAGKPQPPGGVPLYVRSVMQEFHAFTFNGKKCTGIELPADSYGAYFEVNDGRMIYVHPSLAFAILQE